MEKGQVYKHSETGVRVSITDITRSKATGLRWIFFIDRRGEEDFLNEIHFKDQYELHKEA